MKANGGSNSAGGEASSAGTRNAPLLSQNSSPAIYKREPERRVFVNRSMLLEKIQFYGFDMDHTLAVYKSPQMEQMTFRLVIERMIEIGYPEELRHFDYNPIFPVRGLWFDYVYGNLLKVDPFGNILLAAHGFTFLTPSEIEDFYPNKFLHLSNKRVYVLNTLFNLPETYLVACLVDFFNKNPSYERDSDGMGVKAGNVLISYRAMFQDIRGSVDWVHFDVKSGMKKEILANLDNYIEKDDRCRQLLTQLRAAGRKTFLLTNSDYAYTNGVMGHVLGQDWLQHFDLTMVDAQKPLWFEEGTIFREVNPHTGALKMGVDTTPSSGNNVVYSGGSCDSFRRLMNVRGKEVLYIGDHIFGDVLRSKKTRGWRTFLVVPELGHELTVWTEKKHLFERLQQLDAQMADLYRNLDCATLAKPEMAGILAEMRTVSAEMEQEYGVMGSLFRSGPHSTFFASQVERYADIYASSCYNLIYYPHFYFFRAPMSLLPHQSTVDHHSKAPRSSKVETSHDSVGKQVQRWKELQGNRSSFSLETGEEGIEAVIEGEEKTGNSSESEGREDGLNETDVIVPMSSYVEKPART